MKIWIKKEVLDKIFLDGNNWLPKETGGVLMGYIAIEDYIITDFIGPGEKAVHGYHSFQPDQAFHESEVARIYKYSELKITYLGDWHTHPNSFPYLSNTDKKTAHKIAKYKKARLENPIMLVASPPNLDFKIWIYKRNKLIMNDYVEGDIIIF